MGKKRTTNENIHIGEIYESTSSDECGHSCSFYQLSSIYNCPLNS